MLFVIEMLLIPILNQTLSRLTSDADTLIIGALLQYELLLGVLIVTLGASTSFIIDTSEFPVKPMLLFA
ncbi:MAG: hypothetical protein ACFFC1_22600 [Promethearchaeota archaeon]